VTVDWESQGTEAIICIRDTGIGIAAEHIPRLTERFYRVDRGRSRDSGGTGLGLAIVKHALQRYGATLEITSKLGQGSCFTIRWPRERLAYEPK
jgi:two-component system phosphate regulon sensor histidine kinase PhoR